MTPLVKTLIFAIIVPGFLLILVPYWLVGSTLNRSFEIRFFRYFGFIPIVLGAVAQLWSMWNFAAFGKGTPAPIDPPKVFVSKGLYRMVRNPMYVGAALILIGEALVYQSWTLFGFAFLVWFPQHLFVIFYEEPVLKKKFGPEYAEYLKTVPRWIPKRPK